jgi:hypothetical protein
MHIARSDGWFALIRLSLALLMLPMHTSLAYEPERATTNLAHELAECAGFYALSVMVFEAQAPELSKKSKDIAATAFYYSKELTSEKLTRARTEMAVKSMMKEIDNDSANYSILLNKYAEQCSEIVADPTARMGYWLKKED